MAIIAVKRTKRVWVLLGLDNDDRGDYLIGVFSTKELAEERKYKTKERYPLAFDRFIIDEMEIDSLDY